MALFQTRGNGETVVLKVKGSSTIQTDTFLVAFTGTVGGVSAPGYVSGSAADANGEIFMGIALETVDNSAGANGAKTVTAYRGMAKVKLLNASQDDVGKDFYIQSKTALTSSSSGPKAGRLVEFISSTSGWVELGVAKI